MIEDHCRDAISLVPVYFTIVSGQVCTHSDDPLHSILHHVVHQLSTVDDSGRLAVLTAPDTEAALLRAVYDDAALPLVDAAAADLPLDPQHKARLLVEGIAGAIAVVRRLLGLLDQHCDTITPACLARTLDAFAASAHRQRIRDAVEHAHLFSECLMLSQVLDLIMALARDREEPLLRTTPKQAAAGPSFDDYSRDVFCSERERSVARSMGLPWGLTFMVLN